MIDMIKNEIFTRFLIGKLLTDLLDLTDFTLTSFRDFA
jgi:hypothetical protein